MGWGGGGIFRGKRGSVVSDRVTGFKGGTILRKWLESFFCQCPAYFDIWRNFIHFEHSAQLLVAQSGSQLQGGRQSEKALDMTKVTRVYFNRRPQCYYDNLWCQKKNFTSTKNCTFLKEKGQTIVDQSKNLYLKKLNQHFIWSHLNPTADAVFHYSTQAMYYFKTLLMRDLHINVGHYLIKIWKEHIRLHQNFSACLFSPFMQILVAFDSTISNSVNWHWHWSVCW